ncbi:helix-turn-helix domain-containing protein [Gorillibacterium massiliense]|uniref:helix-turn-helix domain-containing protein n=1 Tax=Gorillibacterium massiliense TaxID=1280390 RepID=UPI0004AF585C|nr:helix-turn-helix transcriptional regulator [Gorillibacterium massiliense]
MFRPERLIKLRKEKKLTQEELARKVSTTKGTISNYENGHSTPPHETLVQLANILEVTTDHLLGRNQSDADAVSLVDDPELSLMFRDLKNASPEIREETRRFLEFILERERTRQPADRQQK